MNLGITPYAGNRNNNKLKNNNVAFKSQIINPATAKHIRWFLPDFGKNLEDSCLLLSDEIGQKWLTKAFTKKKGFMHEFFATIAAKNFCDNNSNLLITAKEAAPILGAKTQKDAIELANSTIVFPENRVDDSVVKKAILEFSSKTSGKNLTRAEYQTAQNAAYQEILNG